MKIDSLILTILILREGFKSKIKAVFSMLDEGRSAKWLYVHQIRENVLNVFKTELILFFHKMTDVI